MRFSAAATVLLSAGFAAAASTSAAAAAPTSGTTMCAQSIVDVCVSQYQVQVDTCEGNDWVCLCDNYTNLLTCYNNCPSSNERPPVQNQVTSFCNAAAPIKSSSLAAAATMPKPSTTASSTASAIGSETSSATAAQATASSFNTGAAAGVTIPMGGAFAALLGLAGLL